MIPALWDDTSGGLLLGRLTRVLYVSNLERSERINYHENIIQLVKLIPRRFFGVTRSNYSGKELLVSDLERTLLDVMYRPEYSGVKRKKIKINNLKKY